MTDHKKWFDKKFGDGSYEILEAQVNNEMQSFHISYEGTESEEDSEMGIRLREFEGDWSLCTGDGQFDTDHRGRWGYSTVVWDSNAEDVVEELVSGLHEAYSDIEDWADIDINYVEDQIDGKPYVIYIRTGQSVPTLEVQSLDDWEKESLDYDEDNEDEDSRIHPQFHIAEPRPPLGKALADYRKYLKEEGLSYLLED